MDHSPIRQTFKFGKSISSARKSSLNIMQLLSLAAKYRKYIVTLFPRRSTTVYKIRKLYITIISTFYNVENKLHNFTKSRKLFPTVLKLFSNLRVCLIGKWSIAPLHGAETSFQRLFFSILECESSQHIFFCKYVISIKYVFLISLLVIFTLLILHAWLVCLSDICYLLSVKDLLMILLSRDGSRR